MSIDIPTLVLLSGIIHVLQVLIFIQQYIVNRKAMGTKWWLLWSTATFLGFICIYIRQIPSLVPIIIAIQNPIILASLFFLYAGTQTFFEAKINYKSILILFNTYLLLHLYFYFIEDRIQLRANCVNVFSVLVITLIIYNLQKHKYKQIASSVNFNIAILVCYSTCHLALLLLIYHKDYQPNMFVPSFYNYFLYFNKLIAGLLLTFGFVSMINQRLNNELNEAKTHFEHIFNTSPNAVVIIRMEDRIFIDCNEKYTKLLGYCKQEMKNKTLTEINIWKNIEDRDKILDLLQRNSSCENIEAQIQRKDGTLLTGLISAKVMTLKGIQHIISITQDISEQKAAYEKERNYLTKLKELNTVKDKLFSIIAHDLRSPFSTILGITDLLQTKLSKYSTEEIARFLELIDNAGQNALKLLESLLNWAKTQTKQIQINLEKADLNYLIADTINLVQPQALDKEIEIRYEQQSEYVVFIDVNIVSTVLRNLLTNSIKFTNTKGRINIHVKDKGEFIEISVSDTGIGMSEEIKNSLFTDVVNQTRYGTKNEKGNGLGLAICKEFIEKCGGKINVESEEGKGSCFAFTILKKE